MPSSLMKENTKFFVCFFTILNTKLGLKSHQVALISCLKSHYGICITDHQTDLEDTSLGFHLPSGDTGEF